MFKLSVIILFSLIFQRVEAFQLDPSTFRSIVEYLDVVKNPHTFFECESDASGKKEKEEEVNEEEVNKDKKPAVYVFYEDRVYFLDLNARNDLLAAPLDQLRYGRFIIFDQGETHGLGAKFSYKLPNELRISAEAATRLFTDQHIEHLNEPGNQVFTSEQVFALSADNLDSTKDITISISAGIIEYDHSDDTNIFKASTQQRILHNDLPEVEKFLGTEFYDVQNIKGKENEYSVFIKPNIGVSNNFVNGDETVGLNIRMYVAPEITSDIDRNRIEFGTDLNLYVGSPEIPLIFTNKTIPKRFFGTHIGYKQPIYFHKSEHQGKGYLGMLATPTLNLGLRAGALEMGYQLEMIHGNLPSYIEENKQYNISIDDNIYRDQGDMGHVYLRFNFKK